MSAAAVIATAMKTVPDTGRSPTRSSSALAKRSFEECVPKRSLGTRGRRSSRVEPRLGKRRPVKSRARSKRPASFVSRQNSIHVTLPPHPLTPFFRPEKCIALRPAHTPTHPLASVHCPGMGGRTANHGAQRKQFLTPAAPPPPAAPPLSPFPGTLPERATRGKRVSHGEERQQDPLSLGRGSIPNGGMVQEDRLAGYTFLERSGPGSRAGGVAQIRQSVWATPLRSTTSLFPRSSSSFQEGVAQIWVWAPPFALNGTLPLGPRNLLPGVEPCPNGVEEKDARGIDKSISNGLEFPGEMWEGKCKLRPPGVKAMQSNQDNRTIVSASSLSARSMQAFYRDLPELLKKHSGKWVAYHGDECFGVGRTETELLP